MATPRTALTTMGADSMGSPVWGMNFVGGVGVEGFAGSSGLVYVLRNTQAASSSWLTLAMRLP